MDEAEKLTRSAIRSFEKLEISTPNADYWHFLADSHRWLGMILVDRKRFAEAEPESRQATAINEQRVARLPETHVNDWEWATAYFDLAHLLIKTGRSQEAIPSHRAVSIDAPGSEFNGLEALHGSEPSGRNSKLAVELAERAIAARPDDGMI